MRNPGEANEEARDALIEDIATWQTSRINEYARLERRGAWPAAMPTDVFRMRRIAAHPPEHDQRLFRSSGTTAATQSLHALDSLSLYDAAARSASKHMLFPDAERMDLVMLAPRESEAPDSSLSYMLTQFERWFGARTTWVWRDDELDLILLRQTLDRAASQSQPIALLGTSFAFVHAEDGLSSHTFALPARSRIMQTGGYKGRSREVEPNALRGAMAARYGVETTHVIAEYGMTELSSQLYETTLRDSVEGISAPRRLWVPPWVRATPVDADTLEPVSGEALGVLRIDDCANVGSICCIQTADLARRLHDGIVVEGRAPGADARGCSLAVDQALGASPDAEHR